MDVKITTSTHLTIRDFSSPMRHPHDRWGSNIVVSFVLDPEGGRRLRVSPSRKSLNYKILRKIFVVVTYFLYLIKLDTEDNLDPITIRFSS